MTTRFAQIAILLITVAIVTLIMQSMPISAQDNATPMIGKPDSTTLNYLFPRGAVTKLKFPSDPATDTEGDTITYRFVFTVPNTSTVGDTTDTTEVEPSDALFSVRQSGNRFEFEEKTGTTPHEFNALYGETATYSVPVKMYASEHSNKRAWSAGPAVGSPAWCWDGTGDIPTAVSSLWPGPDDNPPAQNGADDELFSVTLVVSRRPTA